MAEIFHDQQPPRPTHLHEANLVGQQPHNGVQNPLVQVGQLHIHENLPQQQTYDNQQHALNHKSIEDFDSRPTLFMDRNPIHPIPLQDQDFEIKHLWSHFKCHSGMTHTNFTRVYGLGRCSNDYDFTVSKKHKPDSLIWHYTKFGNIQLNQVIGWLKL